MLGVTAHGLSAAHAAERQQRDGANAFTETPETSVLVRIAQHLTSPLTLVLVVAGALTLILGEYIDTVVIGLALALAVVVGLVQEGRATKAFSALKGTLVEHAVVIRDGVRHQIRARDVVVGDVLFLEAGNKVPADARLIEVNQLQTSEASLTGESATVRKQVDAVAPGTPVADRRSMVYQSTYVAEGTGLAVVVAIGDHTEVGQIATALRDVAEVETPLQAEMRILSERLFYIIGALIVIMIVVGVLTHHSFIHVLLLAVAVAVASVPEGLPAAVTIVLAVGMESLLKRGGLVRNLLAAETLGSTTYILTDKTGTLTEGVMKLTGVMDGSGELIERADFEQCTDAAQIVRVAHAASDAFFDTDDAGNAVVRGGAEEQVVLQAAQSLKLLGEQSWRSARVAYQAFTSQTRFAAGVVELDSGYTLCANGAPELLLAHARYILENGVAVALTATRRQQLADAVHEATRLGYRLIAVAYQGDYTYEGSDTLRLPEEMVLAGILVLADPVRVGVESAIAEVQGAGARVVLVTGDSPQTALMIAHTVGITEKDGAVLTGTELTELTDAELLVALRDVSVFARVLPNQKLRIAMVLQQHGEIVAMTGDGINDAPALRRANIGVATGSGTAVAQEASDLVLLEDSFDIMYAAIEEGRRIVANLRKIVAYLVSTSLSEVALIITALLTAGPIPLLPAQILWANIIEEGLMSVAFAFEPGEKRAMRQRPQDIHDEGLIAGSVMRFMAVVISVLGLLNVALYLYVVHLSVSDAVLQSIMFLAIAVDSLFISFSFRSLRAPVWKIHLLENRFFVGSFLISVVLLFGALSIPFMQAALSYTPLPPQFVLLPIVSSVIGLVTIEVAKWYFFQRPDAADER